jgi:hypothetical protein
MKLLSLTYTVTKVFVDFDHICLPCVLQLQVPWCVKNKVPPLVEIMMLFMPDGEVDDC